MHLAMVIELASHRYPEAEALIDGTLRLTYKEWNNRVNAVAWGFIKLGLQPGERIAICARNNEPVLTSYFAAHKAGLTAVLLSTRWKSTELAYALNETEVSLVIYDKSTSDQVTVALKQCPRNILGIPVDEEVLDGSGHMYFKNLFVNLPDYPPDINRDDNTISTILYTSGTTGKPKGVPRTHRSDYYASLALIIQHRWTPLERTLGVMPVYHTMGLHTVISMVILNGLSVLLPNFNSSSCIYHIKEESLTALYLVPTIFYDLVNQLTAVEKKEILIQKLAFAGAPMAPSLIEKCYQTFKPEVFINQYGSTEMHAITINPDLKNKPNSSGRPALHSHIRIVPADANRRVLPSEEVPIGKTGEIIVKANSPQAFTKYLNQPDANDHALRNGWYFTGDLGYLDEEGDLYLKGRLDDMIISGGENIYPQEVEEVLLTHPQVKDAAVVGLADERWGEKVVAFIVTGSSQLNHEELEEFCLTSTILPRFKRPKEFIFVKEVPKSSTGKILRSKLKQDYPKKYLACAEP
ncbi:MAG: class I adenylate-forming enzyme family protein [Bacillota bacterium]|nr:class I adenylate-forming enzyme family protein [Bacillota bacterium]